MLNVVLRGWWYCFGGMVFLLNDIHTIAQMVDNFPWRQEVVRHLNGDFEQEFVLQVQADFSCIQTVQTKVFVKSTMTPFFSNGPNFCTKFDPLNIFSSGELHIILKRFSIIDEIVFEIKFGVRKFKK